MNDLAATYVGKRLALGNKRRGTPYQHLIRDLVQAGLAAGSQPLARLEVSADLREWIATERSVTVEVRRAS
jgi:hypothetical protein